MVTPAKLTTSKTLPDGTYKGIWGGYNVKFDVNGIQYEAKTHIGIRTMRAECIVTSVDGNLSIALAGK